MKYLMTLFLLLGSAFLSAETLSLGENLSKAKPGDYLVVSANKTDTLLHIYDNSSGVVTIEEIATPSIKRPDESWKTWVTANAPGNSSWVMYEIDSSTGKMLRYYSFTKNGWFQIADADNFLAKLLSLKFNKVPLASRRHLGVKPANESDPKKIWQPPMVIDGKPIKGVRFDAWRAYWPQDNTDLSNKLIEIYVPEESSRYPAYFPYWLQISGTVGKARVRIIDSGSGLKSPKDRLPSYL